MTRYLAGAFALLLVGGFVSPVHAASPATKPASQPTHIVITIAHNRLDAALEKARVEYVEACILAQEEYAKSLKTILDQMMEQKNLDEANRVAAELQRTMDAIVKMKQTKAPTQPTTLDKTIAQSKMANDFVGTWKTEGRIQQYFADGTSTSSNNKGVWTISGDEITIKWDNGWIYHWKVVSPKHLEGQRQRGNSPPTKISAEKL